MAQPIVQRVDETALIAFERDLLVGVFWGSATLDHVTAMRACSDQILADHPMFATAIIVLDGKGVFTFPDDLRNALTAYVRETEASGLGTAFVILRSGFVGATVRAFISGIFLLARSKEPQKAFGTVAAAAAWLSRCYDTRELADRRDAAELHAIFDEVLAQVALAPSSPLHRHPE